MIRTSPRSLACASCAAVALSTLGAHAQVSLNGLSFVDLAATGKITLGKLRGSIGVIDYDNDGWYDLFIADNAGLPMRLFHNVPSPATPGGRTFVDVSTPSGIGPDPDATERYSSGVVIFDYNNDGFSDIFVPGVSAANSNAGILFRNNGDSTFTNVSAAANIHISNVNPLCASAVDFDHDGFTDLFIACTNSPGKTIVLFRNNADGTFTSRPDLLPTVSFAGTVYSHAWTDYDHDGWEDALVLLNNGVPLTLKNVPTPGGGRMFIDATQASGFTSVGPAPMGIAIGDINNDGWLDLAITDAAVGTYYENRNGAFVRTTPYRTFFGWGTTFIDAENDADLDNYQAGSFSNANIDWLVRNDGNNTFADARAALNTTPLASQYCARVDFDNDGLEDLITVNPNQFVSVYHNQSTSTTPGVLNHWSAVKLTGSGPVNRDAVGAAVRLTAAGKTQVREIAIGASYSATEDPRAHFGLAGASSVDSIEIVWPRPGTLAERTEIFTGPFPVDTVIHLSPRECTADRNGDQVVDLADFFAFLNCWDATDPCADVDAAPGVDLADFFTFLDAFDTGC